MTRRPPRATCDEVERFVAESYDHAACRRDKADVRFYLDTAVAARGPVLELGCGTGRVLIPIARAGCRIVGIEASPHMLAVCREKVAAEPPDVRSRAALVAGDMRSFDAGGRFALVTMPLRPFQHLATESDQRACLAACHRHLVEHGLLVFDLKPPRPLLADPPGEERGDEPEFSLPDGRRVRLRHRIVRSGPDDASVTAEVIYYVTHRDERAERLVQPVTLRCVDPGALARLLHHAGFELRHVYGDYCRAPFDPATSPDLVVVAARR